MKKLLFIFIVIAGCGNENNNPEEQIGEDAVISKYNDNITVTVFTDEFLTKEASQLNTDGIKLARKNKLEDARNIFKKALLIEPNNPSILNNLGLVEQSSRNLVEAIEYFHQSLLVSDSTYLNAGVNLGLTYKYNNEPKKCIDISNFVISKTTEKTLLGSAYIHLTHAHIELSECDKANSSLIKAKDLFDGIESVQQEIEYLESLVNSCGLSENNALFELVK